MGLITWVFSLWASVLTIFTSLFLVRVRLDHSQARELLKRISGQGFMLSYDLSERKLPSHYSALIRRPVWGHVGLTERLLQAGASGTETVASILTFRWSVKSVTRWIAEVEAEEKAAAKIPIYLAFNWGRKKIGQIDSIEFDHVYFPNEIYQRICREVETNINHKAKSGVLLYGPPGNGKTTVLRHLAEKYKLPIYILVFKPTQDNEDIISCFNTIEGPALAVLEDFDGLFHGRQAQWEEVQFSFDTFLNCFDGVYSSPKGVTFFMTANDIEKVDGAIKARPSRFKVVEYIGCPGDGVKSVDQLMNGAA